MHSHAEPDTKAEYYQVSGTAPRHAVPLAHIFRQTAQYTCVFNSRDGSIACKPFVRTFLKTGRNMTEVTQVVNQGGRLPKTAHLQLDDPTREE